MSNTYFYSHKPKNNKQDNKLRINNLIKAPTVRVLHNGEQLGIFPIEKAIQMAQELALDLIELVPNAEPPVCEIKDYGKYIFDKKIQEKGKQKKQREAESELKQIRMCAAIEEHDLHIKINQIKKFILEGKKVQISLRFKGRWRISGKDIGRNVMQTIIESVQEISKIERMPTSEGDSIVCKIAPQ